MKPFLYGLLLSSFAARAVEPPPWLPSVQGWADTTGASQRVRLLGNDDRVELRRLDSEGNGILLCKAPCGVVVQVHRSDQFILAGSGIISSAAFHLEPRDREVTLKVVAGDRGPRIFGFVLAGAGLGVATIAGLAFALNTGVFCDQDQQCLNRHASDRATAGTVALSSLVVAAVGGAIAIFGSHPTRFTIEE
jgi:hypothetical protein